jgi:hypothetical protein
MCIHTCMQVYLDSLLPQLVALAESDSSRARRVAAYEGLHSVALWLVGNMAQTSQQRECSSFVYCNLGVTRQRVFIDMCWMVLKQHECRCWNMWCGCTQCAMQCAVGACTMLCMTLTSQQYECRQMGAYEHGLCHSCL